MTPYADKVGSTLVQVMASNWPGNKPLSEPMMVSLVRHICVTRPQCVKNASLINIWFKFCWIWKFYDKILEFNTLKPEQSAWYIRYDISPMCFLWWKCLICTISSLIYVSDGLVEDKSTLDEVMAWCHQAASHYINHCWPRSGATFNLIGPQWVKIREF